MVIILIIFLGLSWYLGYCIAFRVFSKFSSLFILTSSYILGTAIAVPLVYIISCLFLKTATPLLWGTLLSIVLMIIITVRFKLPIRPLLTYSDIGFCIFAFGVSSWIMFKTFHGDVSGQLFVGSNNVFDFGLSLGLIRSISQGVNIPFSSPFSAGFPLLYHFFFPFYIAMWEYFGFPIVLAVNIPSILSFSALLMIIYGWSNIFAKKWFTGWLAVFLMLTHPTMTFWKYILENGISLQMMKNLWIIPAYPFAGPFDGSMISLFMTLNNYINQRHLGFGIAFGIILYCIVWNMMRSVKKIAWYIPFILGISIGILLFWNMVICVAVASSIFLLFIICRHIKEGIVFIVSAGLLSVAFLFPYIILFASSSHFIQSITPGSSSHTQWFIWKYLWENLTLLPVVAGIGFVALGKEKRAFIPLILLFLFVCSLAGLQQRGFDQKLISLYIIPMDILTAMGLVWLWEKKSVITKSIALIFFFVLTVSGIVDLLVVKNEFAFPIIDNKNISVISWIQANTPKDAVFVSYADMIDPVVLAGRKNYFGFFSNVGWTDRSSIVRNIYAGDIDAARKLGISYILVPKWNKSDFPYVVDTMYFMEHNMMVYDDELYSIYVTMRN